MSTNCLKFIAYTAAVVIWNFSQQCHAALLAASPLGAAASEARNTTTPPPTSNAGGRAPSTLLSAYKDLIAAVPHFSDTGGRSAAASKPDRAKLDAESRLINKWHADPTVGRPRRNHSERVDVMVGFSLFSIAEVDEDKEVAVLHGWMLMKWTDEHLKWNASEYGGLSIISVPDEMVWKPDIAMYNAASHDKTVEIFGTSNVNVFPNGRVLWGPPATLHVPLYRTNNSQTTTWPHDRYRMQVRLGSWSHGSALVHIVASGDSLAGGTADLSDYIEGNRWTLVNFTARAQQEAFKCCPQVEFSMMLFELEIERKPNFLLHLVGWPLKVVLISTCLVFALPVGAVALRMLMMVGYLIIYAVLLLVLEEMLPHGAMYGERMPVPIVVMVCAMILLLIDMLWVAAIGGVAHISQRRFPRFCLPMMFGIGYALMLDPRQRGDEQKIALYRRVSSEEDGTRINGPAPNAAVGGTSSSSSSSWATPGDGTASEADVVRANVNNWRFLASVLNRIAFLTNVVSVIVIMAVTP